jgi:hypothetical protein
VSGFDPKRVQEELRWLKKYPSFEERPATLLEFLGPDYLGIESKVRKAIKKELSTIMGEEVSGERITRYPLAMITGGIGIGKTTIASIVLPYLCHWVLCLKDPQDYFDLLPGSRIAFMQMSTSEDQAKEVIFGDIKARIQHSPWFQEKYPYDPKFSNQIRFPKDIWILPGDSQETTFEGYNILGGILDEADSHKVTKNKDYAEAGYDTIHARVTSRFQDRGFVLVIGQMKKANGFAAKKFAEMKKKPDAHAVRMTIWDSMGMDSYEKDDDGKVKTFWYDTYRKMITPAGIAAEMSSENLIEIPLVYKTDFENNPEKALRDLAGIPPATGSPFISLVHKIHDARDRWQRSHGELGSPVAPDGKIAPWFRALDSLKRVGHIDIAYADEGDALGFAMGHVREVVEIDGERKPYIVFDLLLRMLAPPGGEIFLSEIRHLVYNLRSEYGFRLDRVTLDGFQSTDTIQQFQRRRIGSELLSVDRQVLPYHDLREAIYEDRIEFPPYMVKLRHGDTELVEIAYKELSELVDEGLKVDHPDSGSKDVADAMAGVTYTLMGDRSYHKKIARMDSYRAPMAAAANGYDHPALMGHSGLTAPVPPLGLTDPRGGPLHR